MLMREARDRVALVTILRKEIHRFLRIWPQTLLPPAITTTLYFVIFGTVIGRRIGDMGGRDYMEYIVPGLVMMSIINSAYANVSSSFFGAKWGRHVEELLVSPATPAVILCGYIGGGILRGLLVGVIVLTIATLFAGWQMHAPLLTLLFAVLTAAVFALAGFINAVLARNFDGISLVPNFILTPLTYLGGVFYSVELLPEPWRSMSLVNPILYMINGLRHGLLGIGDVPVAAALGVVMVFVVVFVVVARHLILRSTGLRS